MRVLGYVMARDEWPMLELAITHALLHHVDEVVAVDHGSTDETHERLSELEARWGGRLKVFTLADVPYLQEAVTVAALASARWDTFDWVYVFDADEFLVTKTGNLRDYLRDIGDECGIVRYQVLNFVTPRAFNDRELSEYASITARADAARFLNTPGVITAEEIALGDANFFDVPFASKVIARSTKGLWFEAGAHVARHRDLLRENSAPAAEVYAAHLPLASWSRLQRKVRQGRDLIAQGFDPEHGWQCQMLARLEDDGQLAGFWEAHSLGEQTASSTGRAQPVYTHDESLSFTIRATLDLLQAGPEAHLVNVKAEPRQIGASAYLTVIDERLQAIKALIGERDGLERERDELASKVVEQHGRCEAMQTELDAAQTQLDAVQMRLDAASAEAGRLDETIQHMQSSASWRITKPLRAAMRLLRPRRRTSKAG